MRRAGIIVIVWPAGKNKHLSQEGVVAGWLPAKLLVPQWCKMRQDTGEIASRLRDWQSHLHCHEASREKTATHLFICLSSALQESLSIKEQETQECRACWRLAKPDG